MKKTWILLLILCGFAMAQRPYNNQRSGYAQNILWRDLHPSTQDSIRKAVSDSLAALAADGVTVLNDGAFKQGVFKDTTVIDVIKGDSVGMTIELKQLSSSNASGGGKLVYQASGFVVDNVFVFKAQTGYWVRDEYLRGLPATLEMAGAKADDATDDAPFIRALLTAIKTANVKHVKVGKGVYLLGSATTSSAPAIDFDGVNSLIFEGSGDSTIFRLSATVGGNVKGMGNKSGSVDKIVLRDFTVDGNRENRKAIRAASSWGTSEQEMIDFQNTGSALIENVKVINAADDAIDFDSSDSLTVQFCTIKKIGGSAVHTSNNNVTRILYNNIDSVAVNRWENASGAVQLDMGALDGGGLKTWIIGNYATNCASTISLHSGTDAVVEGNYLYNNHNWGIRSVRKTGVVGANSRNKIIRNIVSGISGYTQYPGIIADYSNYLDIKENTVGQHVIGAKLNNVDYFNLTDNYFISNDSSAVTVDSSTFGVIRGGYMSGRNNSNAKNNATLLTIDSTSSHITIEKVIFDQVNTANTRNCIKSYAPYTVVEKCRFVNRGALVSNGIWFAQTANFSQANKNYFIDTRNNGIKADADSLLIEGNFFLGTTGGDSCAINLANVDRATVRDNVVNKNWARGLFVRNATNIKLYGNDFQAATTPDNLDAATTLTSNIDAYAYVAEKFGNSTRPLSASYADTLAWVTMARLYAPNRITIDSTDVVGDNLQIIHPGLYALNASFSLSSDDSAQVHVITYVNDVPTAANVLPVTKVYLTDDNIETVSFSSILSLSKNDEVEFRFTSSAGITLTIIGANVSLRRHYAN